LDRRTASRIAGLKEAFGWQDLTEALEQAVEKRWNVLHAAMKRGDLVDQRDIDFVRGVEHGIRILLNAPEKAASIYERQTERQEKPVERTD
jgi:hypothetical protein